MEEILAGNSAIVVRPDDTHKDLLKPHIDEFQPHPGEYHLVEINPVSGVEVPNSDFSIPARTYEKVFKKLENFKVKKNPK